MPGIVGAALRDLADRTLCHAQAAGQHRLIDTAFGQGLDKARADDGHDKSIRRDDAPSVRRLGIGDKEIGNTNAARVA
jgi:hypothetical protein